MVRGFQPRERIDYTETFVLVVKPMSYKAIFALSFANNWEIHQMDVKTPFLYCLIKGEVYVNQPHSFNNGTARVFRLLRALHGLKQSPWDWYYTLVSFLKSYSVLPLNPDLSVYVKPGLMIAIFVDDLFITGSSTSEIKAAKAAFQDRFRMLNLRLCKFYLGITVTRDCKKYILRLGQRAYFEKILLDYQMMDCKPAPTPIETQHLKVANADYQPEEQFRICYQSAVGSLMYAMLKTRPDLAFAVCVVSRYSSRPNDSHWQAVKHIFRYIKATLDLKLTFRGLLTALIGYTYADWTCDQNTQRSISGFVFNLGSGAISWSSENEPTVALSSCKAKYMSQTQAIKGAVWLRSLLEQLSPLSSSDCNSISNTTLLSAQSSFLPTSSRLLPPTESGNLPDTDSVPVPSNVCSLIASEPCPFILSEDTNFSFTEVIIYYDNQGAIALAKNPESRARSKHIDIQWHYQREKIEDGSIEFKFIPNEQ